MTKAVLLVGFKLSGTQRPGYREESDDVNTERAPPSTTGPLLFPGKPRPPRSLL
jgi:hypothetical protein